VLALSAAGKKSVSRRALVVLAVLALVASVLGPDTPSATQQVGAPGHGPAQEWGDAAGLSHESGGRGNTADARSLQSEYPPIDAQDPEHAENVARVGTAETPVVDGFDAATSRELPELRKESQRTFANADGTQTTEFSRDPLNYKRSDGSWQPIDTRLVQDGKGWRNAADSVRVWTADTAGDGPVARLDLGGGQRIAFGVDGAAGVAGEVDGSAITYPDVRPGANLRLEVTTRGLKEEIQLASADAPREWLFPLEATGLRPSLVDGEVVFRDGKGVEKARIPRGFMVDSAFDERMGEYATSYGVTYDLVDGGAALRMTLDEKWLDDPRRVYPVTVDPPVEVRAASSSMFVQRNSDGSNFSRTDDLKVGHASDSGGNYTAASYLAFPDMDDRLRNHKIFGAQLSLTNYHSWSCNARPVTVHPVTQSWTAGTGYSYPGPSYGAALSSKSFAHGFIASGQTTSRCPTATEAIPLGNAGRDLVQRWVNGQQANYGLTVRASATDVYGWKKFAQAGTANPPRLAVTHTPFNAGYQFVNPVPDPPVTRLQGGKVKIKVTNRSAAAWTASGYALAYRKFTSKGAFLGWAEAASLSADVARGGSVTLDALIKPTPPGSYRFEFTMLRRSGPVFFTDQQIAPAVLMLTVQDVPPVVQELYPPNGYSAPSLTPSLWARAVDVDAPPGTAPQYRFEVCDENKANCFDSGRQASPTWTVPAGRLLWSKTYHWRVYASDGSTENEPTPFSALLTAVPQPEITAHLGNAPYGGKSGEFDPQVGNYTASAVDATVSTVGPKLSVVRTYNSLDPRTDSAFGAGWASQYDMRITKDNDGSGNVVVTYPDGQQARFGARLDNAGQPIIGQYTPPPGRYATLTQRTMAEGGNDWTLTDKSATNYVFQPDGRLLEIIDNAGRVLEFSYGTDGKLATVTNRTSGRKLTITWSGSHIHTISTDPVDGTPLTWTYTYDGDKLTQVCDPIDGCTTYEYTPGSHYRSTVVDAKPDSYWRLGEESGTEAQSQIGLNLGADKATYKNVTTGTPGIVDSDTAATFNGTTSAITMPAGMVRKSRELTIEMWFRTTTGGPLFGIQNQPDGVTPTASAPVLYVGTDGKLRGQFWTGTVNPLVSAGAVNDDQWHHVVLSSTINSQTLYLDGQAVGTRSGAINHNAYNHSQVGTAFAATPSQFPNWGTTQRRSFAGVIDEVAVYQHPLGLPAVQTHHRARAAAAQMSKTVLPSGKTAAEMTYDTGRDRLAEYTDRNGGTWELSTPMVTGTKDNIIRTVRVADPGGRAHFYEYDPVRGRILRYSAPIGNDRPEDDPPPEESDPTDPPEQCPPEEPFCEIPGEGGEGSFEPIEMQGARTFTYDDNGFQNTITDELAKSVTLTHDARGNIVSRKTCRTGTSCQTAYFEYTPVGSDLTDPRLDKVIASRDARSSSATDNRYRTAYTYTADGDLETQTTPDGAVVRHTYTTITTPAVGGGNTPAGLVHTTANPRGAVTSYAYFATGDLAEIRSATGLVTRFTYDELGRRITTTEVSDSFPNGVTTTVAYDELTRPTVTTEPAVTNEVSGETHRLRTTTTYDADGNPTQAEADDIDGNDPTRVATLLYDDHNRVVRMTDAEGNETSFGYDPFGNTTRMVDASGVQYDYAYTKRNKIAEVRLRGWTGDPDSAEPGPNDYLVTASYAYGLNGELTRSTDAMGRATAYRYYEDGLLKDTIAVSRNLVLATNEYDAAGNLTRQTTAGGRVTTYETDAVGRRAAMTADPDGLARRTAYTYDLNGNVTQVRMTGRESNTGQFDDLTSAEVVDFGYDPTGVQTSETVHTGTQDLTTTYAHDQRGAVISTTDPAGATTDYRYDALGRLVTATAPQVETEPGGLIRPTTKTGYDTFGATTHVTDANDETWRYSYNKLNQLVSTTSPEYTPPGGNPITATASTTYDPMGRVTSSTNPRGAVTRYEYDQLGRLVIQTDPHADQPGEPGGEWHYTYTRTGELLSATDPTGARSEYTYDDLVRLATTSELERYPTPGTYTSEFTYDDASNLLNSKSPSGATSSYTYDKLNQLIKVTDPSGVVTSLGYDRSGRPATTADAEGRTQRTHYDLAGRPTQAMDLNANGVPLRKTKFAYDRAGNLTTVTNPLGYITRYTSDALGRLQEQVEPVSATESITTTFGYDAAGNQTRYTDGRGNTTEYTVNEWGLPESVIEPSTTAHPNAADRTWTTTYDATANPVRSVLPGGIERTSTYDLLNRLTTATATNTAPKTFDHDALGQVISASTPTGENRFAYNDRGALLSTGGPSGDTNYTYDPDGNLVSRTDAAGTANFGYTNSRLTTMQDSVTGVTQILDYDDTGRLSDVSYGNGRERDLYYDDLGRLTLDELIPTSTTRSVPTPLISIDYDYDLNDRLTTKATTGLAGQGANTYGYDRADRLTNWTHQPPNGTPSTTTYGWDAASNRTSVNTTAATYDQRNRLQSDGTDTYTYSPRGTLASKSGSPVTFDGFDRLTQQGAATYTYDALDRVSTRNGATFTYSGADNELATDGTSTFVRAPDGELLSTQTGADKHLAIADQHGDVIASLPATDRTVADSTAYDPWGKVTAGTERTIGYQGDYTDPDTDQVNMTARWYNPDTGTFTSRDDVELPTRPAGAANRYSYGLGAPTNYIDPTGHYHQCMLGGGGGGRIGASGGTRTSAGGARGGGGASGGWRSSGTWTRSRPWNGTGKWEGYGPRLRFDRPGAANPGTTGARGTGSSASGNHNSGGAIGGWALNLPRMNQGGSPGGGWGGPNGGPGGGSPGGGWQPPPPDPAIAARAANRQAAITNPLPVPSAMKAPLYGSSVTAPVSSAPNVPSKMAGTYRDPIDDVQDSYRTLQEALTNDNPVLREVEATTSAPSEYAGGDSQIHLDGTCHWGGWSRDDASHTLQAWTCGDTAPTMDPGFNPEAGRAPPGSDATDASPDSETFYRGMSWGEYNNQLKATGTLYPKYGETFVTQEVAYIEQLAARHPDDYEVLVTFTMSAGTRGALLAAGARDRAISQGIQELGLEYLPVLGAKKVGRGQVHIKVEFGYLNFGLRKGSVKIFNDRILDWTIGRVFPQ
jgi:RHS repeat-associated protein